MASRWTPAALQSAWAARQLAKAPADDAKRLAAMAAQREQAMDALSLRDSRRDRLHQWQADHPLPSTLTKPQRLMKWVRQGALHAPALESDATLFDYLHRALPWADFVVAAQQAAEPLRAQALGWALFDAPHAQAAHTLLEAGADPLARPLHEASFAQLGYWGLARFPETVSAFRAAVQRTPFWMEESCPKDAYGARDAMHWLLDEGCPEALHAALELGLPAHHRLNRGSPLYQFWRGSDPRPTANQEAMVYVVARLKALSEEDPALDSWIEKARALGLHGASVRGGVALYDEDSVYNLFAQAGGRPRHAWRLAHNAYFSERAPNRAVQALHELDRAEDQDLRFARHIGPEVAWHFPAPGDSAPYPSWQGMAEQALEALARGPRLWNLVNHREPLLAQLMGHLASLEDPRLEAWYAQVPEAFRPGLLEAIARRTDDGKIVQWAVDHGLALRHVGRGWESSTAFLLARNHWDSFTSMVREGRIDLDAPTFEGASGRHAHAPLALQLLRFQGVHLLGPLLELGWDPHRVFSVDGQSLTLGQLMALPPDVAHPTAQRTPGHRVREAFNPLLGGLPKQEGLNAWATLLGERFAALEACGIDVHVPNPQDDRRPHALLMVPILAKDQAAFEPLIAALRARLEAQGSHDDLLSAVNGSMARAQQARKTKLVPESVPMPAAVAEASTSEVDFWASLGGGDAMDAAPEAAPAPRRARL